MKYLFMAVILVMCFTSCETEKEEFILTTENAEAFYDFDPATGEVVEGSKEAYIEAYGSGPCDGTWCGDDHAGCCPAPEDRECDGPECYDK